MRGTDSAVSVQILFSIATLLAFSATQLLAQPHVCSSLSDSERKDLSVYVQKKYKLPESISINLTRDKLIPATCFHELTFEGKSSLKTWELNLYLSPDRRFLSSDLLDTQLDPVREEQQKAQALLSGLTENSGASLGPDQAPVTIVEFSDFECPYCRRFAGLLREVLPEENGQVRVVFHHFPLSMHPWARMAAEGAACAQLQGSPAFWSLHNALFERQPQIEPAKVQEKLVELARSTGKIDVPAFQSCLKNDLSLGLVLRDIDLGTSNQVHGTPTLFINGRRLQGVKDAAELRQRIAEAKNQAAANKAADLPSSPTAIAR